MWRSINFQLSVARNVYEECKARSFFPTTEIPLLFSTKCVCVPRKQACFLTDTEILLPPPPPSLGEGDLNILITCTTYIALQQCANVSGKGGDFFGTLTYVCIQFSFTCLHHSSLLHILIYSHITCHFNKAPQVFFSHKFLVSLPGANFTNRLMLSQLSLCIRFKSQNRLKSVREIGPRITRHVGENMSY